MKAEFTIQTREEFQVALDCVLHAALHAGHSVPCILHVVSSGLGCFLEEHRKPGEDSRNALLDLARKGVAQGMSFREKNP